MVVFGGQGADECFADVYEYAFATGKWARIGVNSGARPSERAGHSAVAWKGKAYVFGGEDIYKVGEVNDFWELSFTGGEVEEGSRTAKWARVHTMGGDPPCPRAMHTAVVYKNSMYVFGGSSSEDSSDLQDLYEFKFEERQWERISIPARRRVRGRAIPRWCLGLRCLFMEVGLGRAVTIKTILCSNLRAAFGPRSNSRGPRRPRGRSILWL